MFGTKTWFQHCRLCISHDSDDHSNVDTVSFNCTLAVTTLSAAYKGQLSDNVLKKVG